MEDSDKERLALEALIDEASNLEKAVNDLLFPYDRAFGIAVATVVGALTIALGQKEKHTGILAVLPFVLVLLFGYVLQVNAEMLSRAGHKRCLEELINNRLSVIHNGFS